MYPAKVGNSRELVAALKEYVATFGVMDELSTDGASLYTSYETQGFLKQYGISHRVSSSYFPHSNQRAEQGVRVAKRLLRDNTGVKGDLGTDAFLSALLTHRNTPAADTGMSPAQVVFGRKLKDFLPVVTGNLVMNPQWDMMLEQREVALAKRHMK